MNLQITCVVVFLNLLGLGSAFGKTTTPAKKSTKQIVTFSTACICKDDHHADRWAAKTDPARPPAASSIVAITPTQIFHWPGVGVKAGLTRQSKRIASEQRWFALTGRVEDVRVEGDGDVHVALVDARDKQAGTVGVEIPPGQKWCAIRKVVFGWTTATFPMRYPSKSKLTLTKNPVITVTGKAFYDIDHSDKVRSNQRPKPFALGYAVWEIHPVMSLSVNN
jgi:hypothetical protein